MLPVPSPVPWLLPQIIDVNYYPVDTAERSNKRHRPIGLGVQVRRPAAGKSVCRECSAGRRSDAARTTRHVTVFS